MRWRTLGSQEPLNVKKPTGMVVIHERDVAKTVSKAQPPVITFITRKIGGLMNLTCLNHIAK
jgi:hypothetical protein